MCRPESRFDLRSQCGQKFFLCCACFRCRKKVYGAWRTPFFNFRTNRKDLLRVQVMYCINRPGKRLRIRRRLFIKDTSTCIEKSKHLLRNSWNIYLVTFTTSYQSIYIQEINLQHQITAILAILSEWIISISNLTSWSVPICICWYGLESIWKAISIIANGMAFHNWCNLQSTWNWMNVKKNQKY